MENENSNASKVIIDLQKAKNTKHLDDKLRLARLKKKIIADLKECFSSGIFNKNEIEAILEERYLEDIGFAKHILNAYLEDIEKKQKKVKEDEIKYKSKIEKKEIAKYNIYVDGNNYYKLNEIGEDKQLTNFIIKVNKSITQKNTDGTLTKTFSLTIKSDNKIKTISVKNEDIIDAKSFTRTMRTEVEKAFVDVREDDYAALRAFMFEEEYAVAKGFPYSGIIKAANQLLFVDEKGAIDKNGNNVDEYVSTINSSPFVKDFRKVELAEKQDFLNVLPYVLKANDVRNMVVLFGFSIYSSYAGLTKLGFEAGNEDLKNVHLYIDGLPSSGKTTIPSIIFKFNGIENFEQYSKKASDTKVALEHQLSSNNYAVTVINELNKRTLNHNKYNTLIDIVKNAYDFLGNSKANADTNWKTTTQAQINCPIITVGQNRFTEDAIDYRGVRARFDKSYKSKEDISKAFNNLNENKDLLYKVGKSFRLFCLNMDIDTFSKNYSKTYKRVKKSYNYDDRKSRAIATIIYAYEIFEDFLKTKQLSIKECLGYSLEEIESLILKAYIDFCMLGCEIDKPVEVIYLEYINKAAELSASKTKNEIKHIAFTKGEDYKLTKKQNVMCLAISNAGLNNAHALINEYLTLQGIGDGHLISLSEFKDAISNTDLILGKNETVKFGKSTCKSMCFIYDKLIQNKIDMDFMLDKDSPEIVESKIRERSLEEQIIFWKEKCAELERENRELKQQIKDLHEIPF